MLPSCARTSTALAHEKNGEQAIGRSRGGLTTKIHALVDALGNPVDVMLTPGQTHDLACAEPLLEGVTLRQARAKFSRGRSPRLRYHSPQLKTGPSLVLLF